MGRLHGPRLDLLLLLVTGALHLVFENLLHAKGPFLVGVGVFWLFWILRRRRKEPALLASWGLRAAPAATWIAPAAVTVLGTVGLFWLAPRLGHEIPAHVWALAVLYLPWALVQEVALQGILLRGLETAVSPRIAPVLAGLLFGVAHLPDPVLTVLTAGIGTVWATLFVRHRTIWPLAVSHAVLGALTYIAVLGRDPWVALVAHL